MKQGTSPVLCEASTAGSQDTYLHVAETAGFVSKLFVSALTLRTPVCVLDVSRHNPFPPMCPLSLVP
eukprot:3165524-Pleurochrysis_carterae.AAC.1